MKNLSLVYSFLLILSGLLFFSCKKDDSTEKIISQYDKRDKVVGEFDVTETEGIGNAITNYKITITKAEAAPLTAEFYVNIYNLGNSGLSFKGRVLETSISIKESVANGMVKGLSNPTVSGSGDFSDNTINLKYYLETGTNFKSFNVVATKKR